MFSGRIGEFAPSIYAKIILPHLAREIFGAVATKIIRVAIFTSLKLNSYVIIDYFDSISSLFTRFYRQVVLLGARNICVRI